MHTCLLGLSSQSALTQSGITSLGNGAAHSDLGLPTLSQTCPRASLIQSHIQTSFPVDSKLRQIKDENQPPYHVTP